MKVATIELLLISVAFASGSGQGRLGNRKGGGKKGRNALRPLGDLCSSSGQCESECCKKKAPDVREYVDNDSSFFPH